MSNNQFHAAKRSENLRRTEEINTVNEDRHSENSIVEPFPFSRKVFVSYGNGSYIDYDYDIADHVKKVTNDFGANGSIVYEYTDYDKVGNRKNMIVDGNEHSYDYDKLYQLVNVDYPNETGMSYGYDKLGNRTSTINGEVVPYASNALNQYTWVLDWDHNNFWYDDNGNMTANGLQFIFPSYDCENRLKDVWVYGGATVIYKYDYLGRLVKRSVVSGATSKYVYDGDQIIAEYDGSNNLVRKFIYGANIDEPVCMIVGSSTYYYHYDGLGSVIALSNAGKQIVEQYSYDVFGTPNTTSSVGNPYMFTGRQYDAQSSLYYYRARFYSPVLGRFLQPDPVMPYIQYASAGRFDGTKIPGSYMFDTALKNFLQNDPVGRFLTKDPAGRFLVAQTLGISSEINLYTYCGNNPIMLLDPYGCGVGGSIADLIFGGLTGGWIPGNWFDPTPIGPDPYFGPPYQPPPNPWIPPDWNPKSTPLPGDDGPQIRAPRPGEGGPCPIDTLEW